MKKEVAILMVISLIVGFLIGYGYMNIRINKMEITIDELRESLFNKVANRMLLNQCLDNAYESYVKNWNETCKRLEKEKNCALPTNLAERWDKYHKEMKEDCFKKYSLD